MIASRRTSAPLTAITSSPTITRSSLSMISTVPPSRMSSSGGNPTSQPPQPSSKGSLKISSPLSRSNPLTLASSPVTLIVTRASPMAVITRVRPAGSSHDPSVSNGFSPPPRRCTSSTSGSLSAIAERFRIPP
eukprot:scaffold135263_cov130-Phaeocystis_antarctica.AAC.1